MDEPADVPPICPAEMEILLTERGVRLRFRGVDIEMTAEAARTMGTLLLDISNSIGTSSRRTYVLPFSVYYEP
jgi:hypothetical protein